MQFFIFSYIKCFHICIFFMQCVHLHLHYLCFICTMCPVQTFTQKNVRMFYSCAFSYYILSMQATLSLTFTLFLHIHLQCLQYVYYIYFILKYISFEHCKHCLYSTFANVHVKYTEKIPVCHLNLFSHMSLGNLGKILAGYFPQYSSAVGRLKTV